MSYTSRRKVPSSTQTFVYRNENPKGKHTDDCVIRALSAASGIPYTTVLKELVDITLKTGYCFNEPRCYSKWLESKGFVSRKQPRKANNSKYTGSEFCRLMQTEGKTSDTFVAHLGTRHIAAIIDGKINDIFNSGSGCVGHYWVLFKKGER